MNDSAGSAYTEAGRGRFIKQDAVMKEKAMSQNKYSSSVDAIIEGQRNVMVGIQDDKLIYVPFSKAIRDDKPINRDLIQTIKMLSI